MSFPPHGWPNWPPPSPQHSTEVEHRLTHLEGVTGKVDKHERRLNLHEKAILGIGAILQVLMQDKYPAVAKVIREIVLR
jgi:hypothetical protein